MRAPHAPPPPLPSRIRKTISAYECLVIVCVCERERGRERERWLCLDVDFHTARQQPKIVTPVFQKQNHAQRSSWNAHFFRTHYTERVRRRQCARAFFPSFYDRYFPVLYRYIRTVWVLSFTSLPSIPLLRQQGADGARYEYDIHIGFLSFVLSCLVDPSMIKSYNITTISLGVVYFFMNMQVSYGLCIVKKTWKFLEISSWQQCCKCCIKRLCAMCNVM
jgi:hypothetical protein